MSLLTDKIIESDNVLDNIVSQESAVDLVKSYIKSSYIPHIIFTGPHGCGKSLLANIIIDKYLGPLKKNCCLKINGSIHRGKNIITESLNKKQQDKAGDIPNIINFIKKTMVLPDDKLRIILIYDFECMTTDAQMGLRRIIEKYTDKVRFIFICNNLNYIIEAIHSRTTIIKLTSIDRNDIITLLKKLSLVEGDSIIENIATISNGDLRLALNMYQTFSGCDDKTLESFYSIFNIPSIEIISNMVEECKKKNYTESIKLLSSIIENGYNIIDIADIILKVLSIPSLFDKKTEYIRAIYIEHVIKFIILIQESRDLIHLYNLIGSLCRYSN